MLSRPAGLDPVRLFSTLDLASHTSVIAAVSGGSDSTALLFLLDEYLRRFAPTTRLLSVTVDHALRPQSAREAGDVARLCARLGIAHSIRTWTADKPQTGLPAAAREARHVLLARAAREAEVSLIITGHTADDQAETVLMRQARHDGRGLAGIAPATLFDGRTWFVRPLLSVRRNELREFLSRRDIGWIDDPSNSNDRFERPRIRKSLRQGGAGTAIAAALHTASHAATQRIYLGKAVATFIRDHVTRPAAGLLRVAPEAFDSAASDVAVYVLRILLAVAGGTPHLPDERRATSLRDRLVERAPVRAVLSRALVDRRPAGIFLLREARGLPEPVAAAHGAIWDGRYRILADTASDMTRIAPVGAIAARSARSADAGIPDSLVRAALACEPVVTYPDRHGDRRRPANDPAPLLMPCMAPWARFLPSFDLAPAGAVAKILRAPQIPAPPFPEHIESKP